MTLLYKILETGITPNELLILDHLFQGKRIPSILNVNDLEVEKLRASGYLEVKSLKYILTKKSLDLILKFSINPTSTNEVKKDFYTKFYETFPSIRLPTNLNFRSSLEEVTTNLKWFLKHYPNYTPETIIKAAEAYVQHAREVNYEYIRTSKYFINKKGVGSILPDWCEFVLHDKKVDKIHLGDRVI